MKLIIDNHRLLGVFSDNTPIMVDLTDGQKKDLLAKWFELDEQYIRDKFYPKATQEAVIKKNLSAIEETGDFYYKDNSLYMNGINLSIPELLAQELAKSIDTLRYEALKKFWILCSLNPNPQARQDLFKFLQGGTFTITSSGLFVAYRNVNIKQGGKDRKLTEFLNTNAPRIKAWKKPARNFEVYRVNKAYEMYDMKKRATAPEGEHVGNFSYLMENLADKVTYTDNYTKTFTIKIGEPVSMPREDCDNNAGQDCSRGLHLGNKSFLRPSDFGTVGLICLCNPYNVVSVPHYNSNKLRCCEYLPIGNVEYKDGKLVEIDTELYEDDYCQFTTGQINEMLKEHHPEEVQINTLFDISSVSESIRDIANQVIKDKNVYYADAVDTDEWDEEYEDYDDEDWDEDCDDEDCLD